MDEMFFKSSFETKNVILILWLICSLPYVIFQIAEKGLFFYFSQFLLNWISLHVYILSFWIVS